MYPPRYDRGASQATASAASTAQDEWISEAPRRELIEKKGEEKGKCLSSTVSLCLSCFWDLFLPLPLSLFYLFTLEAHTGALYRSIVHGAEQNLHQQLTKLAHLANTKEGLQEERK
jgi:hypothetical protein